MPPAAGKRFMIRAGGFLRFDQAAAWKYVNFDPVFLPYLLTRVGSGVIILGYVSGRNQIYPPGKEGVPARCKMNYAWPSTRLLAPSKP